MQCPQVFVFLLQLACLNSPSLFLLFSFVSTAMLSAVNSARLMIQPQWLQYMVLHILRASESENRCGEGVALYWGTRNSKVKVFCPQVRWRWPVGFGSGQLDPSKFFFPIRPSCRAYMQGTVLRKDLQLFSLVVLYMVLNADNEWSAAVARLVFGLSRSSILLLCFECMLKK